MEINTKSMKPEKKQLETKQEVRKQEEILAQLGVDVDEGERNITREKRPVLTPEQRRTYKKALQVLNASAVNYAVGAAFARYAYTNIWRQTKDLDIFIHPEDLKAAMSALEKADFKTEIKEEHWLAKAWKDGYFIDLIFGTGHGQLPIDDRSFVGSKKAEVLGVEVNLIPVEEMIASAAYIAGRNRFDGPEVVHLIQGTKGKLDWQRILDRLGDNKELLFWHLILFDFVYPGHANYLPHELMVELFERVQERWAGKIKKTKMFRGTLLDPYSYTVDVEDWGYEDRRNREPLVNKDGEAL